MLTLHISCSSIFGTILYIYMAVCTVLFSSVVLYSMLHLNNTTDSRNVVMAICYGCVDRGQAGVRRLDLHYTIYCVVKGCQIPQGVHRGMPNFLSVFCLGVPISLGYLAWGCHKSGRGAKFPMTLDYYTYRQTRGR